MKPLLILGIIGAISFAATPPSLAATKKHKQVTVETTTTSTKPEESVPGSEFLKPPPKLDPTFPYLDHGE
jgi:hypothetical protein